MQIAARTFQILFAIFLLICIGVHIYGLYGHMTHESTASHFIHIVSYCLCLLAFLVALPGRPFVYSMAAVYPFMFHAHCAWLSLINEGRLNGICILVVAMLPLGAIWVFKQK
jgi:hypothetical protein